MDAVELRGRASFSSPASRAGDGSRAAHAFTRSTGLLWEFAIVVMFFFCHGDFLLFDSL